MTPEGTAEGTEAAAAGREARAALASGATFFFLLAGYFVLRPVRDLMGVKAGVERLDELFFGVLLATIALNPLFGALVSRWPRRRFLPWAWRAFALQTLGFAAWAQFGGGEHSLLFAKTYFVWLSVFNLFVVSVFWGFMADVWRPEAARRLYGRIAIGGTAGALAGSLVGLGLRRLADVSFLPVLFLASAALIEVAVRCAGVVGRAAPTGGAANAAEQPIGGTAWDGMRRLVRSPLLLGIASFLLLHTLTNTVLYFARTAAVQAAELADGAATDLFFWQEIAVQVATLAIQVRGTAWVLATLGVAGALALGPVLVGAGALAMLLWPSLYLVVGVHALARVAHFAFSKPGSETLYTLLPRGERYKAKSLLDTFVYRLGDWLGAKGVRALVQARSALALPWLALPLCAISAGVGVLLAARFRRERPPETT